MSRTSGQVLAGVDPTPREIITKAVRESSRMVAHSVAVNALQDVLNPLETAELDRIFADLKQLLVRLEGR